MLYAVFGVTMDCSIVRFTSGDTGSRGFEYMFHLSERIGRKRAPALSAGSCRCSEGTVNSD